MMFLHVKIRIGVNKCLVILVKRQNATEMPVLHEYNLKLRTVVANAERYIQYQETMKKNVIRYLKDRYKIV